MNPTLIACKDFGPSRTATFAGIRPIAEAIILANRWIAEEAAEVINVETLTVPVFGEPFSYVRVWYRATDPRSAMSLD